MSLTRPPEPAPGDDVPYRLAPGERFEIGSHDTDDTEGIDKDAAREQLAEKLGRLSELQDRFAAEA